MNVPDQQAWQAWTPEELSQRLRQVSRPWSVVGGWALDLWLGRQTRDHGDLEFTVLRDDFLLFRQALAPLQFYTVRDGTFAFCRQTGCRARRYFRFGVLMRLPMSGEWM